MARPHQSSHHLLSLPSFSTTTTLLLVLAAVTAVASVILSLCTTHKHSKHKHTNKNNKPPPPPPSTAAERKLVATLSGIGSKALMVAKMVSWKRGGGEDGEDGEDSEEAVWMKSILMGEKCRPLDFSGQILYDSDGNEVKKKAMQHLHDHARLQVELDGDRSGPNGK